MENRNPQLQTAIKVLGARQRQHLQATRPQPTKLVDKTFYLNVRVDGMSGINQLVDSNTKKLVGVTNFDGNLLNSGRDVVIDSIRTLFTSDGTSVENANWQNSERIPSQLQNADLRMIQTNDLLIDLPMTDTQNFKNEDHRPIATTPVLRNKEEFKLELEFPKGVTVPNTKPLFMRLEFRVTEAKNSKSKFKKAIAKAVAFKNKISFMKQIHYVAKAIINPGESTTSVNFKLPSGFTTSVGAYTNRVEITTGAMVSIEMKDDNSIAIIPMIHIDNFRPTSGGDYQKSFKPLNFDTGNKDYSLLFALEEPLQGGVPLKIHVVFLYDNTIKTN